MNGVSVFTIGLALTMAVAFFALSYLQQHLKAILTDLCGTKERAAFWTAFSNVTLFLTPLIFALHFQPGNGSTTVLVYGLSNQIAAALLGFIAAIVMLGIIMARFIAREKIPSQAQRADTKV